MKNKNAALVLPKFGLTVEKEPGAAIKGGSTRIRLLADSELTQVNKTAPAAEVLGVGSLRRHRLLTRAITQLNSGWMNPC